MLLNLTNVAVYVPEIVASWTGHSTTAGFLNAQCAYWGDV